MNRIPRQLLAVLAAVLLVVSMVGVVGATSLTGSNFEIDNDANLIVDGGATALDWANVTETRRADSPSGQNDESFGNGTKEDTAVPSIVDGGIPPNKSDLKFFGVYQEGTTSNGFLNLFWARVQDPSGTTNMDFEFNQSSVLSANGVTPVRTAGDLLVTYDLSRGGTHASISLRRWTAAGVWGASITLSDTLAQGTINTTTISAANSDGLGSQSPRTFGEAQIRLAGIFTDPTICQGFGSAYLKSRSSDSFTSALKDFVPPVAVNISNCGSIDITKVDDGTPGNPLEGAVFTLYNDAAPVGGTRGAEDTITTKTCQSDINGECSITGVQAGTYWVVETTGVDGYDLADDQAVTIAANGTVELTFVDPKQTGAITITKTAKHAAADSGSIPLAGVDFTVDGSTYTTGADGTVCIDGLDQADYTVSEVAAPTGYAGADDQDVTVDNAATCADDPYVGESVSFSNTPLTDITVSVDSQVVGGTASTIECAYLDADPDASTDATTGDGSLAMTDLVPGTYSCTIVVDP